MKKLFILTLCALSQLLSAQVKQLLPGHPDRSAKIDLKSGFTTPPKGYGEVPFYWWMRYIDPGASYLPPGSNGSQEGNQPTS